MSLRYVKGSMKNVDQDNDGTPDTLTFKLINYIGTGSSYVTMKVIIDGKEYTDKASISIAGRDFVKIVPDMFVYSTYGDEITIKVDHGGQIELGKHKVVIEGEVAGFHSSIEFEDVDH